MSEPAPFYLAVCAKDLPQASLYTASVAAEDGTLWGSTGAADGDVTTSPVWQKLIAAPTGINQEENINLNVTVSTTEGTVLATATLPLAELTQSYYHAAAAFTKEQGDQGAKIALKLVSVTEIAAGELTLQLRADDLPDTDFGIRVFRKKGQHTDACFEIYSAVTGTKLLRSNVVEDELSPLWDPIKLDLDTLTGENLDAPIRITVMDKDGGGKVQYLGQVMITVNQMLGKGEGVLKHYPLIVGGMPGARGSVSVASAVLTPGTQASRNDQKHLQLVITALDAQRDKLLEQVKSKKEAAKTAAQAVENAQAAVEALQPAAKKAAAARTAAQTALAKAHAEHRKLQAAANTTPCSGKISIILRATNLPDTDFGIRNKTDPIFEIFRDKERLHRSNIVENNLNPVWDAATLDLKNVGDMNTMLTIVVSDKDGGKNQSSLGQTECTVQALVDAAGKDEVAFALAPSKGKLYCQAATLDNFVDHVKEAQVYATNHVEPKDQACQAATATFEQAQAALEDAQGALATATEASVAAQDAAEAAQLALQVLEAAA